MLTRGNNSRQNCRSLPSRFSEIHGRHVGTRTPDLYRVKSEVKRLQPFSCLAFPFSHLPKTDLKQPIFGDELVTSSVQIVPYNPHFLLEGFWHTRGHTINAGYGLTRHLESKRNHFATSLTSFDSGGAGYCGPRVRGL